MTRAVLSIGSNVGDRLAYLRMVVEAVEPWIVASSRVFQTPPWGPVEQRDFLNAVLIVDDPAADARDWLERGWAVEHEAGRIRDVHWGPRKLDVDVVDVDGSQSADPVLTLPHPHAHQRAFVLVPWLDADPAAVLVGHGAVAALVAALPDDDFAGVIARPDYELRP